MWCEIQILMTASCTNREYDFLTSQNIKYHGQANTRAVRIRLAGPFLMA